MTGMGLIEHEAAELGLGALAARTSAAATNIGKGESQELERTFLVKRMEINGVILPHAETAISGVDTDRVISLGFYKTSGGADSNTPAEVLDAALDDDKIHRKLIWMRMFNYRPFIISDAEDEVEFPPNIEFNTTKSFTKGYPLDKDEIYSWQVFNHSSNALSSGALLTFRVRYWGVYI